MESRRRVTAQVNREWTRIHANKAITWNWVALVQGRHGLIRVSSRGFGAFLLSDYGEGRTSFPSRLLRLEIIIPLFPSMAYASGIPEPPLIFYGSVRTASGADDPTSGAVAADGDVRRLTSLPNENRNARKVP
jgi:hypothetical protein